MREFELKIKVTRNGIEIQTEECAMEDLLNISGNLQKIFVEEGLRQGYAPKDLVTIVEKASDEIYKQIVSSFLKEERGKEIRIRILGETGMVKSEGCGPDELASAGEALLYAALKEWMEDGDGLTLDTAMEILSHVTEKVIEKLQTGGGEDGWQPVS